VKMVAGHNVSTRCEEMVLLPMNETSSHYELVAPTRVRRTAKQRNIITSSELPNTQNKNEKLIHCTMRCMVLPTAPTPSYQGREFSHALPILCAKKWTKLK